MTARPIPMLVVTGIAAIPLFLAGCKKAAPPQPAAAPIPSAQQVENAVRNLIEARYSGNLRIVSFAKTDGIPNEFIGNNGYITLYNVTVEFKTNGFWMPHSNPQGEDGWIIGWVKSQTPQEMEGMTSWEERRLFHPGQQGRVSTQISAVQSERGWQFDSSRGKIAAEFIEMPAK